MASALDTPVKAYNDSVRLPAPDLVARLRDLLGAKLVAYLGSVKETRAVRQWAEGERTPSDETLNRLRLAYRAAVLIAQRDTAEVAQAWFMGANPQLGEVAPARLLREGELDEVGARVIRAAETFAAVG